jgi:hypothetical protein
MDGAVESTAPEVDNSNVIVLPDMVPFFLQDTFDCCNGLFEQAISLDASKSCRFSQPLLLLNSMVGGMRSIDADLIARFCAFKVGLDIRLGFEQSRYDLPEQGAHELYGRVWAPLPWFIGCIKHTAFEMREQTIRVFVART